MAAKRTRKPSPKRPKKSAPLSNTVTNEPPPSPLRGLLPTPPEVSELVERWLAGRPATPEARRRMTDDLKLQYYFGGYDILTRETEHGVEVLAVDEEIDLFLRQLTNAQRLETLLQHPDPW